MPTVTISMRLPDAEAKQLEKLAADLGLERPTFLRRALKRGAQDLMLEWAFQAYREGGATLSRAAEMAGLSLRDMILQLESSGTALNYGKEDLAKDLEE